MAFEHRSYTTLITLPNVWRWLCRRPDLAKRRSWWLVILAHAAATNSSTPLSFSPRLILNIPSSPHSRPHEFTASCNNMDCCTLSPLIILFIPNHCIGQSLYKKVATLQGFVTTKNKKWRGYGAYPVCYAVFFSPTNQLDRVISLQCVVSL